LIARSEAPIILRWQELEENASLPRNVNISIGTRYEATANFAKLSSFTLIAVQKGEIERDLKVTLFSNGCTAQLDALLTREDFAGKGR